MGGGGVIIVSYVPITVYTVCQKHICTFIKTAYIPEHVSGAERGASEERSVPNIVGARSGFLSKGWSDRSVSLRCRSDTAHTTSLGHAQIHPEFTCAFNN